MTISEPDVVAMRGPALLAADGEVALPHVTLTGRATLVASLLVGHGLEPGGVVAVLAPHTNAVHELLAGVRRAGLVMMVIDPGHSLEQSAFAINTSGARVLVVATEHAEMGQALAALTPYVTARYGLDAEFPGHRSLPVARSAARVRAIDAAAAGTLHHVIAESGRPAAVRLPDPVEDADSRARCLELFGGIAPTTETVLVSSADHLAPITAQLVTTVLAGGGSVAAPRRSTGVETMRTAFGVEATMLHLTVRVASEIASLEPDRVRRLTPPGLNTVVAETVAGGTSVMFSLAALWGDALRPLPPGYLSSPAPAASEDCSVTHAEI